MSVPLESLLKRDRVIVVVSLAAVTALAWLYLFWIAGDMTHSGQAPIDMPDMPGMSLVEPALKPWTVRDFAFTFAMWAVMMAGMMTPSASPMILLYTRVARQAAQQGQVLASAGWFAAGYLLSWTVFSLAATIAQAALERAALLTPMMVASTNRIGGVILISAGLYQWTALKSACLSRCRSPLEFIQSQGGFKRNALGSLRVGLKHGLYCIGCCWALMTLLFAGGVMNVMWIAAIAVLVLMEKVLPRGKSISRIAGVGFVVAGLWLLMGA
jgi:predicted metal-binding membrane protein